MMEKQKEIWKNGLKKEANRNRNVVYVFHIPQASLKRKIGQNERMSRLYWKIWKRVCLPVTTFGSMY